MVWKLFDTIGKAIVETAKSFIPRPIGVVADAVLAIIDNEESAVTESDNIRAAQLKLQYLQHQDNIEFQNKLAKLKHEQAKEIQIFIQEAENVRLQKNLDFQHWCLGQQKTLQLELFERNQKLQHELLLYQRQTSLKLIVEQKRLENSPIWLVASDILNSHPPDKLIPLRIFFAPPKLLFDRFTNIAGANNKFPDIELTLAEGMRQFFRQYSNAERTVDFLAGAWVSKSFHSEASIKAVYSVLKSEPTLVLESEVDGDYLNFRIAYWGWNGTQYDYEPIISRLPYQSILSESAKARARKWLILREQLIATGEKPEEVDLLYGGDNITNSITWQKEEKFIQAGIDPESLNLNYLVNQKDFEYLCQFLHIYHCLFAGLKLDEYFLVQYNLPPLLPLLFSKLTANIPDGEVVREIILSMILYYQKLYQALEKQRSGLMPELLLDLALSLAHLEDKSWAEREIIHSLQIWLESRNLSRAERLETMLKIVSGALSIDDADYVTKLNQCLAIVACNSRLSVKDSCYERGMLHFQKEEYEAAILNFDRAIEIKNDWAEAYYNRGLAYARLKQYQAAIKDYTQALAIDSNWADAYNNRGNAYYKLGNYERASADYERTLSINPDHTLAKKNRDIIRTRQQAQSFTENLGKDVLLELVAIPGGTFTMGSPESEKESHGQERPQHLVTIQPFYMGKYPVTQAQWRAIASLPKIERDLNPEPSSFKGGDLPVERVSWYDALEFCARLSQRTKRKYRLPSEAEWEYACRAGTTTAFHFGETITPELANYDGNYIYGRGVKGAYRMQTTPVGYFKVANPFGLYDLHGNVWEWCEDDWHDNYEGAPRDGSAWLSRNDNTRKVRRGGSWVNDPWGCRSASRNHLNNPDCRSYYVGLRVVCEAPRTQ